MSEANECFRDLNSKVNVLNEEVTNKSNEIENLTKLKNDAEWTLGEHISWLEQANNRSAKFQLVFHFFFLMP